MNKGAARERRRRGHRPTRLLRGTTVEGGFANAQE